MEVSETREPTRQEEQKKRWDDLGRLAVELDEKSFEFLYHMTDSYIQKKRKEALL